MHPDDPTIREFLAAALRKGGEPWPAAWDDPAARDAVGRAAIYHGIAGLLVDRCVVERTWPSPPAETLGREARAQAMWELRHRQLLADLLAEFQKRAIPSLLMKGTAVAYDLYETPATRSRGDTDLLVAAPDRPRAEALLGALGYAPGVLGGVNAAFALQQPWTLVLPDGGRHSIDLHWQVMNAPSLNGLLPFAECSAEARPLPRLSPEARAMGRVHLLLHTCLHRAMHCNTPYIVDGEAFHDSGRLIWSFDMHLLAEALDDGQWSQLCALASANGVARVCLEGLRAAQADIGTAVPAEVIRQLEQAAPGDRRSAYFVKSRSVARAWQDLRSVAGLRSKLRYGAARILPDPRFVRAKYPGMAGASLPMLYARRMLGVLLSRGKARQR